jgi:hypothetical protein
MIVKVKQRNASSLPLNGLISLRQCSTKLLAFKLLHMCAVSFISLSNCYLFTAHCIMFLHADCIAPPANKHMLKEKLSDLVHPLH